MCSFSSVISLRSTISSRWRFESYYFLDNSNTFKYRSLELVAGRLLDIKNIRKLGLYFSNFVFSDTTYNSSINLFDLGYFGSRVSAKLVRRIPRMVSKSRPFPLYSNLGRIPYSAFKGVRTLKFRLKRKFKRRGFAFFRKICKGLRRIRLNSRSKSQFLFFNKCWFWNSFGFLYIPKSDYLIVDPKKFWVIVKQRVIKGFSSPGFSLYYELRRRKRNRRRKGRGGSNIRLPFGLPKIAVGKISTFSYYQGAMLFYSRFTHLRVHDSVHLSLIKVFFNTRARAASNRLFRYGVFGKFLNFVLSLGVNTDAQEFYNNLVRAFINLFKFTLTYLFRFKVLSFLRLYFAFVVFNKRYFPIFKFFAPLEFPRKFFSYSVRTVAKWLFNRYYFSKIRGNLYSVFGNFFGLATLRFTNFSFGVNRFTEVSGYGAISPFVVSSIFKHKLSLDERLNPSFFFAINLLKRKPKVLGVTFSRAGRFIKWPRAVFNTYRLGRVSFNSYLLPIDFSYDTLIMKYSKVSFKVWLSYAPPINFFLFTSALSELVFPSSIFGSRFFNSFGTIVKERRLNKKGVKYYVPTAYDNYHQYSHTHFSYRNCPVNNSRFRFFPGWDYKYFRAYRKFYKFFRSKLILFF